MAEPKDEGDQDMDDLIRGEKKQARQYAHDDDEHGGDHRLPPVRPGDLGGLGADVLEKLKGIGQGLLITGLDNTGLDTSGPDTIIPDAGAAVTRPVR